jgi:signal peptidase I
LPQADKGVIKEALNTLKVSRELFSKHSIRLAGADQALCAEAITALDAAIKAGDETGIRKSIAAMEAQYTAHLAKYRKSAVREYAESIGWAVLIALTLRAFVIEPFKIPSGSMIPTLLVGDHIFANKFTYGLRIPFTFIKFWERNKPARGDVVVFIKPDDPDKDFIKRVVGIEGDSVEVRGKDVFINGTILPREGAGTFTYRDHYEYAQRGIEIRAAMFRETLGGAEHDILIRDDISPSGERVYTVKPGNIFVMGDNRDNSSDSRVWGQVPLTHVKGKAMFIWWSWSTNGGFRFDRMFHWIN